MKRFIFCLFIIIMICSFQNCAADMPYEDICIKWTKYYEIDYNFLQAIWIKEGSITNPKTIGKLNYDGTRDIGLFQINAGVFTHLQDMINIKDLTKPEDNIKSACFLLYQSKLFLDKYNIPITTFNLAACYNNRKFFIDYWKKQKESAVVQYGTDVFNIYYDIEQ